MSNEFFRANADFSSETAARLPLLTPTDMSEEQRSLHDEVVAGPRGKMVGPLLAAIHSPELARRWSRMGEFLRYKTRIPPRLSELAILVTARRWTSQVEWAIHSEAAIEAGVSPEIVDAIRGAESPEFNDEVDALVYEYARQLQQSGEVELALYKAVEARWETAGVVELTAIIGYYTMVSMTLNAHHIPLPESCLAAELDVPESGRMTALPPCVTSGGVM